MQQMCEGVVVALTGERRPWQRQFEHRIVALLLLLLVMHGMIDYGRRRRRRRRGWSQSGRLGGGSLAVAGLAASFVALQDLLLTLRQVPSESYSWRRHAPVAITRFNMDIVEILGLPQAIGISHSDGHDKQFDQKMTSDNDQISHRRLIPQVRRLFVVVHAQDEIPSVEETIYEESKDDRNLEEQPGLYKNQIVTMNSNQARHRKA